MARNILARPWDSSAHAGLGELAASLVTTNRPEVMVTAVKPASRGSGIIVRLCTYAPAACLLMNVHGRRPKAFLRYERDLEALPIAERACTTIPGAIASFGCWLERWRVPTAQIAESACLCLQACHAQGASWGDRGSGHRRPLVLKANLKCGQVPGFLSKLSGIFKSP
jgi:hypothetical protein